MDKKKVEVWWMGHLPYLHDVKKVTLAIKNANYGWQYGESKIRLRRKYITKKLRYKSRMLQEKYRIKN